MLSKEAFKMIEGFLDSYDSMKKEIQYIKDLIARQDEISAAERAYLVSCGENLNKRTKSEQDIEFVESFLSDPSIMQMDFQIPCVHHVENAEFCEAYGIHMSRCPLVCSENNCPMLDTGLPKTSMSEERFGRWLTNKMPELVNEISKFLRKGEIPPSVLVKTVVSSRTRYETRTAEEYLQSIRDRHKPNKGNKRKPISTRTRFEVLKRDNFICQYCGAGPSDGVKLHVDHIVPVSKGGRDEMGNYRTACESCNLGKSNIELEDSHEHIPDIR